MELLKAERGRPTIIQVSHDERVAAFGRRIVEIADGWISGDRHVETAR